VSFNLFQYLPLSTVYDTVEEICEGSPKGTRKTTEERMCERDEFEVWSK